MIKQARTTRRVASHVYDDGVVQDNSDRYEMSGSDSQTIPMESGDEN